MNIYTDGAARDNGKYNVRASYSAVIKDKVVNGLVMPNAYTLSDSNELQITNIKVVPSNNRGELLGIIHALLEVYNSNIDDAKIYSDSLISVKTINEWYPNRKRKGTEKELKNLDLIEIIMSLVHKLRQKNIKISFNHINGHVKVTSGLDATQLELINGNTLADKYATSVLR